MGLHTRGIREAAEEEALDVPPCSVGDGCKVHSVHRSDSGATEVAFDGNAKEEVAVVLGKDHVVVLQGLHRSNEVDEEAEDRIRSAHVEVDDLEHEEGVDKGLLFLDDKEDSSHRTSHFCPSWSLGTTWSGSFLNLLHLGLQIYRLVWQKHHPWTYHHENLSRCRPCCDCCSLSSSRN